jgi:DNA-binding LacI/PurR family transcriptional regulator/DNA-binding transcriptional regulator YhcF (GntR family)
MADDALTFTYQPAGRRYPLCRQIEDHLRGLIAGGHWAVGEQLPSRLRLAQQYRVDVTTLQRAIVPLVADGTLRADRGGGTYVQTGVTAAARPEAPVLQAAHPIIGIVPTLYPHADPADWSLTLVRTLERTCAGFGIATRVFNIVAPDGERSLASVLQDALTAGLHGLAVLYFQQRPSWLADLQALTAASSLPLMVIATEDIVLPLPHTFVDEQAGGYQAARHLLQQGYRRIGFLTPFDGDEWLRRRVQGARQALAEAGSALFTCPTSPEPCGLGAWTERPRPLEPLLDACLTAVGTDDAAIMVPNDSLALALLPLLRQRGICPGDDLGLISFDDSDAARAAGLTSMRMPLHEMADMAGVLMAHAVRGHALPLQVRLQATCIPRESTRRRSHPRR